MATTAHLDKLNAPQRKAVTHGEPLPEKGYASGPLLIVAGAGTGKTDTLAHRVAHLVIHGVDPARILMLTFTRRAATEMRRRAHEITRKALNEPLGGLSQSIAQRLTWAGTFHAIGNRLLRHYAAHLQLDPHFTVIDRADSADLMDSLRQELGFAAKEQRFPRKETCLQIYSNRVNTRASLKDTLERNYPWCVQWEEELTQLYRAYVEQKQRAPGARLRRPAALLARDDVGAAARAAHRRAFRSRAGGRVPGHQPAAGRDSAGAETRRRRARGGRRRRPGDLLVSRRGGREHPRLPGALQAARRGRHAGAELPLDPAGAGCRQRGDGGSAAPAPQVPAVGARRGGEPRVVTVDELQTQAEYVCTEVLRRREANVPLRARRCCSAAPVTATCSRWSSPSARSRS